MAAHKIGDILAHSGGLGALSRPARRLAELERLLFEAAPRALTEAARVNGIRAGILLVSADNAAVAAKLRQLAPRLLIHITEREPQVTGIRVDVQPAVPAATRAPSTKQVMSPAAVARLDELASGLPESALKTALARLVRRRTTKSRQP